jgi:hypothetical protein
VHVFVPEADLQPLGTPVYALKTLSVANKRLMAYLLEESFGQLRNSEREAWRMDLVTSSTCDSTS